MFRPRHGIILKVSFRRVSGICAGFGLTRRNCRVRQRSCGCGHLPAAAHLPLATCGHCTPRCGRHPCAVDNGAASGGGGGAQGTRARSTVRRRRMGVVSLQRAPHELPHDSTHEPASRRWSHGRRCTARSTAYSAPPSYRYRLFRTFLTAEQVANYPPPPGREQGGKRSFQ